MSNHSPLSKSETLVYKASSPEWFRDKQKEYLSKFGVKTWVYAQIVGWKLVNSIAELGRKADFGVWVNPKINANGPDMKFYRGDKLVVVAEVQNRRYNYNYRPTFNHEVSNLSRFVCGKLLTTGPLQSYSKYRKKLDRLFDQHKVVHLELPHQINPFYHFFEPEEIEKYRIVKELTLIDRQRILMSIAEAEENCTR